MDEDRDEQITRLCNRAEALAAELYKLIETLRQITVHPYMGDYPKVEQSKENREFDRSRGIDQIHHGAAGKE